jgi:hypothetical protein
MIGHSVRNRLGDEQRLKKIPNWEIPDPKKTRDRIQPTKFHLFKKKKKNLSASSTPSEFLATIVQTIEKTDNTLENLHV